MTKHETYESHAGSQPFALKSSESDSDCRLGTVHESSGNRQRAAAEPSRYDEECIRRVEEALDTTEMAIESLRREDSGGETDAEDLTAQGFLLSVVMPVFNEQDTLLEILRRVRSVPIVKELIIVDDCSTDGTRDILRSLEQETDIRVIYQERNCGKGAALRAGFAAAKGDIILVQDADLEYDPYDYPSLLIPILEGRSDVVFGSRFLGKIKRDPSFVHRMGNRALTWLSNRFTGQRLSDMETCYKVFRREVLSDFSLKQDRFGFEPEFTAKVSRRKQKIVEVPIHYNGRGYEDGKKIGVKDGFNALWCIVRYGLAD